MSLGKEFKEFIARGNVIDLAVGVVIGAAFGKIVNSLVTDVIMPPVGLITGKVDFSSLFVTLDGKTYGTMQMAKDASAPIIAYGVFLNTILQFLIVAAAVFLVVKLVNRLKREQAAAPAVPAPPPRSEVLLEEIRDVLKNK